MNWYVSDDYNSVNKDDGDRDISFAVYLPSVRTTTAQKIGKEHEQKSSNSLRSNKKIFAHNANFFR